MLVETERVKRRFQESNSMRNLFFFVAVALVCPSLTNAECDDVKIDVVQDRRERGRATPVATRQSVSEFYNYGSSNFNGPSSIPLAGKRSVVFLHQDKDTCELSLVLIHSKAGEGDFMGSVAMYITGELWNPVVKDDPEFTRFMLADDEYDQIYLRRNGFTRVQWYWSRTETDGLAQPLPDGWRGCFEIDPDFENATQEGQVVTFGGSITEWAFVSSDSELIDLDLDEPLFICLGGDRKNKDSSDDEGPFPPEYLECDDDPVCGYCERPGMNTFPILLFLLKRAPSNC